MVAKAGAGPPPIHHKLLNADNLAEAIVFCQTDTAKDAAEELGRKIRGEVSWSLAILMATSCYEVN